MEEIEEACRIACVDEVLERLPEGYETEMGQGGVNVSGGQKQRICIARALLKKPKILILDDSTSAVDTKTDALIRKAFREEIPDTTKIIIAQRVSSVEDADMIIVMEDGMVNTGFCVGWTVRWTVGNVSTFPGKRRPSSEPPVVRTNFP